MSLPYRVRPANENDGEAIRRLVFDVLQEYGLPPDPEGTDADLKNVAESYQNPGGLFDVVVDEAGEIVGTVGLFPITKEHCELRKMYLVPHARKQGHGRRLLEHALIETKKRGFRRLELETASVLVEAIALYERYGFRRFTPERLTPRCDCAYYLQLGKSAH
jgi:GNAT superfamily N-acetyltransferase